MKELGLEDINEIIDYNKIEDYLENLVAENLNISGEIVIPQGGCIYDDRFTSCNFEIIEDNEITGMGVISVTHVPAGKGKISIRQGVIFTGDIRGIKRNR